MKIIPAKLGWKLYLTCRRNLGGGYGTKIQGIDWVTALYDESVSLEERDLLGPLLSETLCKRPTAIFWAGGKTIDRII
jgi:hypothetical protein